MSLTTLRNVKKRKAAVHSEKKWQEAIDADIVYNIQQKEMKQESSDKILYETLKMKPKPIKKELIQKEPTLHIDSLEMVFISTQILEKLISSLACPNCKSESLNLSIKKKINQTLENISVYCSNCETNIFRIPSNYSGSNKSEEEDEFEATKVRSEEKKIVETTSLTMLPVQSTVSLYEQAPIDETCVKNTIKSEKPLRPCVFCSAMQPRLRHHIRTSHSQHPFVLEMVQQSPRNQAKMMRQLRSEGILAENNKRLKLGRKDLLRVRNQGTGQLSVCDICGGYYKKNVLWRHRTTCTGRPQLLSCDSVRPEPDDAGLHDSIKCAKKKEITETLPPEESPSIEDCDIDQIKSILNALQHGIFTQSSGNGDIDVLDESHHVVRENLSATSNIDSNSYFDVSAFAETHMQEGSTTGEDLEEDQQIFESLPNIINKVKTEASTEPTKDDNLYYEWPQLSSQYMQDTELLPCDSLYEPNRRRRTRTEFQYQFWKKEDESRIMDYFSQSVETEKVPGKDACFEFLKNNPDIATDWTRVKYKVYNEIQKRKKRARKTSRPIKSSS